MRPNLLIIGMAGALLLGRPAPADELVEPSLTAIAAALRENRAADAKSMATQMLVANSPVPLDRAYLLLDRGLAYEQLGKRGEAEKDFTTAVEMNVLPRNELARALFDRGVILDEMGRTEEAIADYAHAIDLVPRYATALNNRGNAYRRTGRFALARKDYQAALDSGDDEPEYPLYGLGRVAEAQGDPAMAKAFYQRALAANSNFTPASTRMAALEDARDLLTLHVPEIGKSAPADTPRPDETKRATDDPFSSVSSDDLALRPAILDGGRSKSRKGGSPNHTAAFVPPEPAAGAAENSGGLVQLGAWRNQGDAALGWDKAAAAAGSLLNGAAPRIVEADIPGKGHFWRLRTHAPAGLSAADFCSRLRKKGLSCITAKS